MSSTIDSRRATCGFAGIACFICRTRPFFGRCRNFCEVRRPSSSRDDQSSQRHRLGDVDIEADEFRLVDFYSDPFRLPGRCCSASPITFIPSLKGKCACGLASKSSAPWRRPRLTLRRRRRLGRCDHLGRTGGRDRVLQRPRISFIILLSEWRRGGFLRQRLCGRYE